MTEQGKQTTEELIDIFEYAKAGKKPPKGKSYRIRINKESYVVDVEKMTGREIRVLAGATPPEQHQLNQKVRGQMQPVGLDDVVDFTTPGIEKFLTIPLDQGEG